MDTISRFKKGVHGEPNCGRNRNGYAAINSILGTVDIHRLGKGCISSSLVSSSQEKKKTFACSDILAYILIKTLVNAGFNTTYILLLSSNSFFSSTVSKMIQSIVQMHSIAIVVQKTDTEFNVTMMYEGIQSNTMFGTEDELLGFFLSLDTLDDACAVIYPCITEVYKDIVSKCKIGKWCIPLSRKEVYVSPMGNDSYFHNVFPWSRYPSYSGFTLGNGPIQLGSLSDRQKYIGSFNFYESMISSIPVGDSCTDCRALQTISEMISSLIGQEHKAHRHTLSSSSMEVLESLERRISESITQF